MSSTRPGRPRRSPAMPRPGPGCCGRTRGGRRRHRRPGSSGNRHGRDDEAVDSLGLSVQGVGGARGEVGDGDQLGGFGQRVEFRGGRGTDGLQVRRGSPPASPVSPRRRSRRRPGTPQERDDESAGRRAIAAAGMLATVRTGGAGTTARPWAVTSHRYRAVDGHPVALPPVPAPPLQRTEGAGPRGEGAADRRRRRT